MKKVELTKPIDSYHRLHIPKEVLQAIHVKSGDFVALRLGHDPNGKPALIITKHNPGCVICWLPVKKTKHVVFKGRLVCDSCWREIIALGEQYLKIFNSE